MVKWYNESLPRISRGFDYPWPHQRCNPSQDSDFLTRIDNCPFKRHIKDNSPITEQKRG